MKKSSGQKNNSAKMRTSDLVYIALFCALCSVCSWLTVPGPVPFTLQTFGIFTTLLLLGGKRGTISILCYILLGMIGAPVFSGFNGGIGVLAGPTGGYIVGFVVSGVVYWIFTAIFKNKFWAKIVGILLGLIAVYTFGTIWFLFTAGKGMTFAGVLAICVIPFIPFDIIKIVLSFIVAKLLKKAINFDNEKVRN